MKKAVFPIIAFTVAIILVCSGAHLRKGEVKIEQDIVLVEQYINYAWEYQNYGKIIDREGKSHEFDFSNEEKEMSEEEFLLKLMEAKNKSEGGKLLFQPKEMKKMYELLYKVDEKKGFDKRQEAVDYGRVTLYGLRYQKDGKVKFVKLHSYGDYLEEAQDRSAKTLYQIYNKVVKSPKI